MSAEKDAARGNSLGISPQRSQESVEAGKIQENNFEVFKNEEGAIDFRTVHWLHASMIFLKIIFAVGVLTVPSAMYALGAVPGTLTVLVTQIVNTYYAVTLGQFRNNHAQCHSIADMAHVLGGVALKEVVGILFLLVYAICCGSGIVGVSTALNALSNHSVCTNVYAIIATIIVAFFASVRKFEKIAWLTWIGFISIFVAVFIVVIGVTTRDRPAAAPQTGPYDLGFYVIAHPTFTLGITATANIFCSSAATSAFLPVISEMRRPRDYNKAVYLCMGFVTVSYIAFSLVVYYYCGQWVASPSLGSAGPMIKKISYGVGIVGLVVSGALYAHIASKYLFVRILRRSSHLQRNTVVHWGTWFGCVAAVMISSYLIGAGIPIFSYILALAGSLCFAPLGLILPGALWIYDHPRYWRGSAFQVVMYGVNVVLICIGVFLTIGGTYGVIQQVIDAYASGAIGHAFSCADNSNSS